MVEDLLVGLGFMLILEGILPSSMPKVWKASVQKLSEQADDALRRMGLVSVLLGLGLVFLVRG